MYNVNIYVTALIKAKYTFRKDNHERRKIIKQHSKYHQQFWE